jgi:hypothetical protein
MYIIRTEQFSVGIELCVLFYILKAESTQLIPMKQQFVMDGCFSTKWSPANNSYELNQTSIVWRHSYPKMCKIHLGLYLTLSFILAYRSYTLNAKKKDACKTHFQKLLINYIILLMLRKIAMSRIWGFQRKKSPDKTTPCLHQVHLQEADRNLTA